MKLTNDKITFFLPVRSGSNRVKNKNTRSFGRFKGGILENKIEQLTNCSILDEIILSTNDPQAIEIGKFFLNKCPKLKIINRPNELCLDSTDLQDLINYVPTITKADHIVWGHTTTPFFNSKDYTDAIDTYLNKINNGFDSLMSVSSFNNFLFNSKGEIINNLTDIPWPRTQDLETLYEVNHAVFIASRDVYVRHNNRIGIAPFLHLTEKIKSFDIDWEEDFLIAESLYEKIFQI